MGSMSAAQLVVRDSSGAVLTDATAQVFNTDAQGDDAGLASIYTDGGTLIDQVNTPISTGANGVLRFNVTPGIYNIQVNGPVESVRWERYVVGSLSEIVVESFGTSTLLTIDASHAGKFMRLWGFSNTRIVVPNDATENLPVNTEIYIVNNKSWAYAWVDLEEYGDLTINYPAGFAPVADWQSGPMTLKKVGPNEWDVFGALATASDWGL